MCSARKSWRPTCQRSLRGIFHVYPVLCVILVCFQGAFKGCLLSSLPRNEMLIDNHSEAFRAAANIDIDMNITEIQRLLASVIYWMVLWIINGILLCIIFIDGILLKNELTKKKIIVGVSVQTKGFSNVVLPRNNSGTTGHRFDFDPPTLGPANQPPREPPEYLIKLRQKYV